MSHILLLDEERDTFEAPVEPGGELPHTCGNEAKALAACLHIAKLTQPGNDSEKIVDEAVAMALDALGIKQKE